MFLPITEAHPHAWLPELLAIWGTDDTTPFLDHCLLSLLSRLAEEKYLLVDWRPHLPLIFGHVLRVFDLPVSRGGGDTNYDHCAGASDHPMFGCRGWSLGSVHSEAIKHASRLIVWLLGGGEGGEAALLHLQQLVRSLEGFYHPSSVHDRSTELASLLVFLPAEMVARTEREAQRQLPERDRLQQPLKDALVEMWTPIALLGMQGKSARCAQVRTGGPAVGGRAHSVWRRVGAAAGHHSESDHRSGEVGLKGEGARIPLTTAVTSGWKAVVVLTKPPFDKPTGGQPWRLQTAVKGVRGGGGGTSHLECKRPLFLLACV